MWPLDANMDAHLPLTAGPYRNSVQYEQVLDGD